MSHLPVGCGKRNLEGWELPQCPIFHTNNLLSIYFAEPFSTRGLSSETMFSMGFCSPHTTASRYPSSKSLSRISSSAGSSAQLKSWSSWQQEFSGLYREEKNHSTLAERQDYLSSGSPILRIAVWTNPNSLQSQPTCWKSTNADLQRQHEPSYTIRSKLVYSL